MSKVRFLTIEEILLIHQDQIDRYGGSHGLRDIPLLESAILRPQTTFGGNDLYETIADKAAALLHLLINNHPFIDGNKRTAAASMLVFLTMNGISLAASDDVLVETIVKIAADNWSVEQVTEWLTSELA